MYSVGESTIRIVTSTELKNNYSGDVAGTIAEYVQDIFGSEYTVQTNRGYDVPESHDGSEIKDESDLHSWWKDEPYTSENKNLLVVRSSKINGRGMGEDKAAVFSAQDYITNVDGPQTDSDLIGDEPTAFQSAPKQIAFAIHEIGHMYSAVHDNGYCDEHRNVNFLSPMIVSYVDDYKGGYQCDNKVQYDDFSENRYVQGYTHCNIDYFPSEPAKTYTTEEIKNL